VLKRWLEAHCSFAHSRCFYLTTSKPYACSCTQSIQPSPPTHTHNPATHCRLVISGSGRGMLLSMQCCWSGSPPVMKGFLKAAGLCCCFEPSREGLLRRGIATGGSEKVQPDCVCLLLVLGPSPWLLPSDWLWLGWLVASDCSSRPVVWWCDEGRWVLASSPGM